MDVLPPECRVKHEWRSDGWTLQQSSREDVWKGLDEFEMYTGGQRDGNGNASDGGGGAMWWCQVVALVVYGKRRFVG